MKPFTIHVAAGAEVHEAIEHYENQRAGLGREFRQEFESVVNRIRDMPQSFAAIDERGTRKLRFRRFPYTVYYVDWEEAIWIVQRRRPGYWSGRISQNQGDA